VEKKEKVVSLLKQSKPYYESPESQCQTCCYFTPSRQPKALHGMTPNPKTMLGAFKLFATKDALTTQQSTSHPASKSYLDEVEAEETVKWYPVGGFVARKDTAPPFGGTIVFLAKFVAKDEASSAKLADVLSAFAAWVKENEPGVLTYCVLTRPEAPLEVLMFERYKDVASHKGHASSKEFRALFKNTGPFVQGKKTAMSEFEELDFSFVGNVVGGGQASARL